MGVEICGVGGFNEIGRNMTAIKVDDEVIIIDMGLHLEKYIAYTEGEDEFRELTAPKLTRVGAIPDINPIKKWMDKVKAIIPTHAHLDHIGAVPYLSNRFDAPILTTPYAVAVINTILKDDKIQLENPIRSVSPNSIFHISKNIKVEFIHTTHSIPQSVMVAVHTKYGVILYANDFKFDSSPVLGAKPNFKALREVGKKGVLCLIIDSIYASEAKKTPSEQVAKDMLKDVLLGTESGGKTVVVTTFASHLARLKSIIECGKKMNRKIIFLGRSLHKYVNAGEDIGIINFTKDVELVKFGAQIKKKLRKLMQKDLSKFLFVVTGHQAEPKAVLSKMINKKLPFVFKPGDHVVFSCAVIPTNINIANREILENNLKALGVRIFRDIHVSGHAAKEDQRDLIEMVKPKHIIPAHCGFQKASAMGELASEMGYQLGKNVHIIE
ncbi:RNase J family beta-CASP ribonuclease, partial [Candidatus Woesearchaeota archaeon]|nr:RNase J family beta-CASP ribonuclease [Candidatus Woesearchaeota archaeon]